MHYVLRMQPKHWLLCFVLCLTLPLSGYAQKITISGRILDGDTKGKSGLSFATVQVENQAVGAYSDDEGYYSIEVDKAPKIIIKFSYTGYLNGQLVINNPTGTSIQNQNITLDIEGSETDEVLIETAAKGLKQNINQLSISTQVLDNKFVDLQASTDLISTVEQIPGVQMNDDQPSIRGSSGYTYGAGSRVLTLLNGLPMISANRGSVGFSYLPTDNIASVEIIKGASSVLYGTGAMGGIINVLTKDPNVDGNGTVRLRTEIWDNPANDSANWDGRSSGTSMSAHIAYGKKFLFGSNGHSLDVTTQVDLINSNGPVENEFERRFRGFLMTKYHFGGKLQGLNIGVNFQASIDSSSTAIAFDGYPVGAFQPGSNQNRVRPTVAFDPVKDAAQRGQPGYDPEYAAATSGYYWWAEGNQWVPSFLSYQRLQRYSIDPFLNYVSPQGNQHIYRGRLFLTSDEISSGQGGTADLHYHEYQYVRKLRLFSGDEDTKNMSLIVGGNWMGNRVVADSTFGRANGNQYSAFAQLEAGFIKWADGRGGYRLNLSLGGRYQYEQVKGDPNIADDDPTQITYTTMNDPVFRVGANFAVLKATFVRASVGQGIRSPSIAERFTVTNAGGIFVAPSPDVTLERGYTAEVGLRQLYRFGESKQRRVEGFLDVSAFTMQFSNLVEFLLDRERTDFSRFYFSAQNIGNAAVTGLEAVLQTDVTLNKFIIGVSGGLTLIDPVNKNGLKELDDVDDFGSVLVPPDSIRGRPITPEERERFVNDVPYTLKYRNRVLGRATAYVGYKNVTLTCNWRYASHMENVDKLFLAVPGLGESVRLREVSRQNNGNHVFDFILSYHLKGENKKYSSTVSLHAFNAFNEEYLTIPGTMGQPRSYAVQYRLTF